MEILGYSVHLGAIAVSAIVAFGIGMLWYTFLFGKQWLAEQRFTEAQKAELGKNMATPMIVSLIGYAVTATVLSILFDALHVNNISQAITFAFYLWLGFPFSMGLIGTLYGGRSVKGFFIDAGNTLTFLIAMAAILVSMK